MRKYNVNFDGQETSFDRVYDITYEAFRGKFPIEVYGQHEGLDIWFALSVARIVLKQAISDESFVDGIEFSGFSTGSYLSPETPSLYVCRFTDGAEKASLQIENV